MFSLIRPLTDGLSNTIFGAEAPQGIIAILIGAVQNIDLWVG